MPRGDGTGPNGMGSMTGRGLGYCNDEDTNSNTRATFGRGRGLRYPANGNMGNEKTALKNRADSLKRQLDDVQKRLDSFNSQDNK